MNRFSKWIPLGVGAMILAVIVTLVGCGTSSSAKGTQMRIVHLSPDEAPLDLLIDNKSVSSAITYGVPTAFVSVAAGTRDLKLNLSSGTTNVLDSPKESFAAGTSYTYLIIGFAATLGGNKLTDDHTKPDKGKFKIRVVNGSPTSGSVDVFIVTPGTDITDPAVKPTIAGLGSTAASTYQSLDSGSYHIVITASATKTPVLVDAGSPTFSDGQNRTLIMLNQIPGSGTYTTLPLLTDLN